MNDDEINDAELNDSPVVPPPPPPSGIAGTVFRSTGTRQGIDPKQSTGKAV